MKVTQLCLTFCDPMDYTVHGILQARILQWVSCFLLQGIFPTQGLNLGLLHYALIKKLWMKKKLQIPITELNYSHLQSTLRSPNDSRIQHLYSNQNTSGTQ